MIKVWADIGGTFTDCFVSIPGQPLRWTKVLSSGSIKGRIDADSTAATVIDRLRVGDPDRFWNGSVLRLLDPHGTLVEQRHVESFTAATGQLQLAEPFSQPPQPGWAYELTSDLTAPVIATRLLLRLPADQPLPPLDVRMGTTRGTNALLTRRGAPTAFLTTAGFEDLLEIGQQDRPDLFTLNIVKRKPLYSAVAAVEERIAADGTILQPLDLEAARQQIDALRRSGAESLAIGLLNAYINPAHEQALVDLALAAGFANVSASHRIAPVIKLVDRAETTVLDAYLNPVIADYVARVWQQFGGVDRCQLQLMTSGGTLVPGDAFRGKDSILSGPAGGVVALAEIARAHGADEAIGFDMGGTSTDVSRFAGQPVRQYEAFKAGTRILTPMMAIETVAAGGGSICRFDGQRMCVGPESAGADPGPACYGRGGPLTVTDLNVVLGRVLADRFPFPMDRDAAIARLAEIQQTMEAAGHPIESAEALAAGFRAIANHHMAEAVRAVTTAEGRDPRGMTLVGFGGAAGQHLCDVAEVLGIRKIIDHPQASLLSALGMGLAATGNTQSHGIYRPLEKVSDEELADRIEAVTQQAIAELPTAPDGVAATIRQTIDVRYLGTDAALEIDCRSRDEIAAAFHRQHREQFGYQRTDQPLELVAVRATVSLPGAASLQPLADVEPQACQPTAFQDVWLGDRWQQVASFDRDQLVPGAQIVGPAIVASDHHTLIVDRDWKAQVAEDLSIVLVQEEGASDRRVAVETDEATCDPVLLEIFASRFQQIANQMGLVLGRTAISVNVKERRDYSCAIFRGDGSLVANAPHVPVHLGAMGHTVRSIMQQFPEMFPGDCFVTNDPFAGGSHLPDVTVITPVFVDSDSESASEQKTRRPDFFVASRAHHAEIGGITPGSMPPDASNLSQEGVLIRGLALVRNGQQHQEDLKRLLSAGEYPSRCVAENLADIAAQQAAGTGGARDLCALVAQYGGAVVDRYMMHLQDVAAAAVSARLRRLPAGAMQFKDSLDDGTPICVQMQVIDDRLRIDFAGTAGVHPRGFNATPAIVTAAVLYVLRTLIDQPLPLNEGVLRCVDLHLPVGLLNPTRDDDPRKCPAVVAGNVETSQRVVDVLLGALGVAAASQGTMNNFVIGDATFGYYETICGGSGATATGDGASAVHTHMTNTRITDPEVLELRYPMRLIRFAIRRGSGGVGEHRGGDGAIREVEFLKPLTVSLLTGRRTDRPPYGLAGGADGALGENWHTSVDGVKQRLAACCRIEVQASDRITLLTPGGGGYGLKPE
ncbi:hydantoinase B/oxoprolinase family protein [Rosistilla oblonga]|uniref:hydantoinase B/oxoprolinase family protein n=1 Tax=Rosistilla oblonga TaxID=2527990 RepID=UPI003A985572